MSSLNRKHRTRGEYALLFLKGMGMGVADSVPGVSGGTIAVIARIYDELIGSIRSVDERALRLVLSGQIKGAWDYVNGTFLLTIVAGALLSLRLAAGLVTGLLESQFEALMAFFIGLVIAAIVTLRREVRVWDVYSLGFVLGGLIITVAISSLSPYAAELSLAYLFLCGMIAICAMILPGLSGAFLLLMLGAYNHMLTALVELQWLTICVFVAGCAIGILLFSRFLAWALKTYHSQSYGVLIGMLLGSVYVLWPWQQVDSVYVDSDGVSHALESHNVLPTAYEALTGQNPEYVSVILAGLLGFALILIFDKLFRQSVD